MNTLFKRLLAPLCGGFLLMATSAHGAVVTATFNAPTDVLVSSDGYTAEGNSLEVTLNHAPANGANLTVVDNTGTSVIAGTFSNLSQGQKITLTFGGRSYGFVANYHGGNGNDLVLQWENSRWMGWGYNGSEGRLGIGPDGEDSYMVPLPVVPGALAGKTVIAGASGGYVGLISCSDGSLISWGRSNQTGRTGPHENGTPYLVDRTGVLAGKTIVGMSAGFSHVLVLNSDGTMATWGSNVHYQSGIGPETYQLPVAVAQTGALAGKSVIAISSGTFYNAALCSDGTVVSWGRGSSGQLGDGTFNSPSQPAAANTSGVLNGKKVVSIATGREHTLALCSDGSLFSWGLNSAGQLGNGNLTTSNIPVAVNRAGVLAGKTITAISAGAHYSVALCSDGTVATWGDNATGQLGNSSTTLTSVPVAVVRTGALAGKTVTGIRAGMNHCLACCSDGTAVAWGYNAQLQLGNTGAQSTVPVLVSRSSLRSGERIVSLITGPLSSTSYAIVGAVPPPIVTVLDPTLVGDTTATLRGNVNANGTSTAVSIEFGTTTSYGNSGAASPAFATGTTGTGVSRLITGLLPGTTYHYRVVCTGAAGTTTSENKTFTTTSQAALSSLSLSAGTLDPDFAGNVAAYNATVPFESVTINVTPTVAVAGATVQVNGTTVPSATPSDPVNLDVGSNTITVLVTSPDGQTTKTYTLSVVRQPKAFSFAAASAVPLSANGFFASGSASPIVLAFNPPVGTTLMMIRNTGIQPIRGNFDNLTHGQIVNLSFGQSIYRFVVNYYGGTGNDLVLQWANTTLVSWGYNIQGQLGDNSTVLKRLPVMVDSSGPLAGKTVIALSAGRSHSLALCSDGKILGWGNISTRNSRTPVELGTTGILAGKTVSAISAGDDFSLALCSDGTLVSWGRNSYGQLGDGTEDDRGTPVAVDTSGVLAGKRVVAISTGASSSLALCSDGTVASWGSNFYGELGGVPAGFYKSPVALDRSGVLAGKTVVAIDAGAFHGLALCSDGTFVSWGYNQSGQLGNNSTTNSWVPVAVNRSGVLSGKTVVDISASASHNLVACSDGTLAAWGFNGNGQVGDNTVTDRLVPVAVNRSGFLAGKTVTKISTGLYHSIAQCNDGTLAIWGANSDGQLGTGGNTSSPVPIEVNKSSFGPSARFVPGAASTHSSHNLALLANALPAATTLAASDITGTSVTLHGNIVANGGTATVTFEYGLKISDGAVSANPPTITAGTSGPVSATLSGLLPGTTYQFRVRAESSGGVTFGSEMSFTTPDNNSALASLSPGSAILEPAFNRGITDYIATVPFSASSIPVTAQTENSLASVKIGSAPAATGGSTISVNLAVGSNTIPIVVTAEDQVTKTTYQLHVTRLPDVFTFDNATDVPLTTDKFIATGLPAAFALNYPPAPGTILTAVNNTGLGFILGAFSNLSQGQEISLTYQGTAYHFVANYFGGSGNDLVLQWAGTKPFTWGSNSYGQLGTGGGEPLVTAPAPVGETGILSGKTITAVSGGYLHTLALCSDGTLAAWGYNIYGQLGNGGNAASAVPVPVDRSGALAGKTVIAISAGPFHNLALCSDGSVVAWGYNNYGQLGTGGKVTNRTPVSVISTGALAGKQVVGIAAGAYHSLVRCSDGTVVAWGYNDEGELGDDSTTTALEPVAVNTAGALAGKQVSSISAGQYHTLALCTDGTLVSWGYNKHGELGDNTVLSSKVPVAIGSSGALAGKVVVATAAGSTHSMALCEDGTVATWGSNAKLQLGVGSVTQSLIPVAVDMTAVAPEESVSRIATGGNHSLAYLSNGGLAAWGDNAKGQLGNNSGTGSGTPSLVDTASMETGELFMFGGSSSAALHNIAVVAIPMPIATAHPPLLLAADPGGSFPDPDADTDNDGIPDLVEHAFGLDLAENSTGQLPEWQSVGNHYVVSFVQPAGVTGITYGAESSPNMEPGSWTEIPDSGTGTTHTFSVPYQDTSPLFLRFRIETKLKPSPSNP